MTRRTTIAWLSLFALAGCGHDRPAQASPAKTAVHAPPQPELRDVLSELQKRAAAGPLAPDADRLAELRDVIETAWIPDRATSQLRAKAASSLSDEKDIDWALEEALLNADPNVRMHAAEMLGKRGRRAAIPMLAVRLRSIGYENDEKVRCAIMVALARLGVLGLIEELNGWMQRPEAAQVAGLAAIDVLRAANRDPGESPSYADLEQGILALAKEWRETGVPPEDSKLPTGPAAADPLLNARIAKLLVDLQEFQLRPVDETRFVLTHTGRLGLPLLHDALHAEQPYLRTHGLEIALGLEKVAHETVPDVMPLLNIQLDAPLAAKTLGAIGAHEAFDNLIEMLGSDRIEYRAAAANALGRLGDLRAVDGLLSHLRDEAEVVDVRVQAAYGLALLDPGVRYLDDLLTRGAYHEPTLRELLDDIHARRR